MAKINYSTAELDAAIATAQNLDQVTFTPAEINQYLGSAKDVNDAMGELLPVSFEHNGGAYCIFARIHHSSWGSANHYSALISGGGSYGNNSYGLFWSEGQCRSGNINMSATQIKAPGSGTPVFGHYDGGDDFEYFGVKRGSAKVVVWPLQIDYNDSTAEFKAWAMTDTQPSGWTTISTS